MRLHRQQLQPQPAARHTGCCAEERMSLRGCVAARPGAGAAAVRPSTRTADTGPLPWPAFGRSAVRTGADAAERPRDQQRCCPCCCHKREQLPAQQQAIRSAGTTRVRTPTQQAGQRSCRGELPPCLGRERTRRRVLHHTGATHRQGEWIMKRQCAGTQPWALITLIWLAQVCSSCAHLGKPDAARKVQLEGQPPQWATQGERT